MKIYTTISLSYCCAIDSNMAAGLPSLECPCEFCFKVLFPFKFESMISYTSAHFVPSVLHFFPSPSFCLQSVLKSHAVPHIHSSLLFTHPTTSPLFLYFFFLFSNPLSSSQFAFNTILVSLSPRPLRGNH